jgi:hypothetical protein
MIDSYNIAAKNYLDGLKEFLGLSLLSDDDYQHAVHLAASVMMTRDGVLPGGGFVQAVVDNNLSEAVNRADSVALVSLKALVMTKMWCHLK